MRVTPTEAELTDAIHRAARMAFAQLFAEHSDEHFYYCSLITTGEALSPVVTAWSHEALHAAAESDEGRRMLAWSYADSPYYCSGAEHFEEVNRLFSLRPAMDPSDDERWDREWTLRLAAMEEAMARLDREGPFGEGTERLKIVVAVEVMPPDATNTERVMRLNPPEAIREWLNEVAEPLAAAGEGPLDC